MAKGKSIADVVENDEFPYVAVAPGQYLFTQDWEQQSLDCESLLTGHDMRAATREQKEQSQHRRMLSSARFSPSLVNGATPTPGDPDGTVWPHLIMVEA